MYIYTHTCTHTYIHIHTYNNTIHTHTHTHTHSHIVSEQIREHWLKCTDVGAPFVQSRRRQERASSLSKPSATPGSRPAGAPRQ